VGSSRLCAYCAELEDELHLSRVAILDTRWNARAD
jgi:hypothetical protein